MDLRVTPQSMVSRAIADAHKQNARLEVLQQQASSGQRLLAVSDDPVDAVAALSSKAQDQRLSMYLENIQTARATLDHSVSALTDAGHILAKAKQVALEANNSWNDQQSYTALANEVDDLLERLQNLANTQNQDRYLFAGTATDTVPFVTDPVTGAVAYQGAQERALAGVNQEKVIATFHTGSEIFQSRQRQTTVFTGSTGAAAGSGTDSATGQGTLLVTHTLTSYALGSGVQPGTGSVAGDTIVGPPGAHQLTVVDLSGTGANGTIALNGGPPVAFTNTDTNLQVSGPRGEVVFVDATAITAGFNGNVAITATGTLSVDGGATSLALNFSSNQVVTDSITGAVTNVDSSNLRFTGTDQIFFTGTFDAFQILAALRDNLRNTQGLTAQEQAAAFTRHIQELDRLHGNVLDVVGAQSAILHNLEGLESRLGDLQLDTNKQLQELENVDLSEVIIRLQEQMNLIRLTLANTASIFDQSLLDFIR